MRYAKPSLTFEQQADLLLGRGLVGDRTTLISRLRAVSYYRLSAYWRPFRQSDDTLRPSTTLDVVWGRYVFDRRLRLLVMDAIERVEVAILRTLMVEKHTLLHGPFGYREPSGYRPDFDGGQLRRLLEEIDEATRRSREEFVRHFRAKYTSEPALPLWMASEVASFGSLFTMFRHLHHGEQKAIAGVFGLPGKVLESWLHTLNYIRNLCAHHGRLWNRELAVRPMLPQSHPAWQATPIADPGRVYVVLCLLNLLMRRVAPQSAWADRVKHLIADHPTIPPKAMGIPPHWEDSAVWRAEGTS